MTIDPKELASIAETIRKAQGHLNRAARVQSPAAAIMGTMNALDLALDALRDLMLALGHKP